MASDLPKVTPYLLNRADDGCSRWLHREYEVQPRTPAPFLRWRLRNPLLARLAAAHTSENAPRPDAIPDPPGLLPEEVWYFRRFVNIYCHTFRDRPGVAVDHGCSKPNRFPRRGLEAGGAVDLLIDRGEAGKELRQLELWGRKLSPDPMESWEIAMAVLRLAAAWHDLESLRICHVDLHNGQIREAEVDLRHDLPAIAARFDSRLSVLRKRAIIPEASPGLQCGGCNFIVGCEAWGHLPLPVIPDEGPYPSGYLHPIISLSPTSAETWSRCPRQFRARHLLDLPPIRVPTASGPADLGLLIHALLRRHHLDSGSCHPDEAFDDVLASISPERVAICLGYLERHSRRCPQGARSLGHEYEAARLNVVGLPFMVTGRIDALWIYDGWLDARDYKTGALHIDQVRDDLCARMQAWILAPIAERLGVSLRLRHEYLHESVGEDPDPFTPDEEDLAAIEEEVTALVQEISDSDFAGVADPSICEYCPYEDACPDAAQIDEDVVIRLAAQPDAGTLLEEEPF